MVLGALYEKSFALVDFEVTKLFIVSCTACKKRIWVILISSYCHKQNTWWICLEIILFTIFYSCQISKLFELPCLRERFQMWNIHQNNAILTLFHRSDRRKWSQIFFFQSYILGLDSSVLTMVCRPYHVIK